MSGITDLLGGNIGGALTGAGGNTQQQTALGQYNLGEGLVDTAQKYAQAPESTMKSASGVGNLAQQALTAGNLSTLDAAANSRFINQQASTAGSGIGSLVGGLGGLAGK